MGEKLKGYGTKAVETVKKVAQKVSKKVWIAVAAVLVVLAVIITIILNNKPYSVLFTGLSSDEASTIMNYLETYGATDYRLENNDTILVPESQADALKVALLKEGYPQSGFAYTYTGQLSALSTESERNIAILQDLQDRMAATIRCMDGVKDAVVTITQGEDHSYVLDSGNVVEASAYVLVTMRDNTTLSDQMASAIRTLVSHGAQGLEIDNVAIVDSLGNTYTEVASSGSNSNDSDASALKLQLEESYNNKIRTEVLAALIPFFGEDNVKVGVNCSVDVSYSETDSSNVYLPEYAQDGSTNGAGIIGSRVYSATLGTDADEIAGGVVGTETNADLSTYVEAEPELDGSESRLEISGQIDYDNSKDQVHTVRTAGYITDCTISVSINSATAGSVNLDELREHVATAAGISAVSTSDMTAEEYLASKVHVMAMPFYEETASTTPSSGIIQLPSWMPAWALYAAIGGLLLFVILLILILMLLGKRKKKKAAAEAAAAEAAAAAAMPTAEELLQAVQSGQAEPTGADVMSLQSEHSMELRKSLRKFVDENPEFAAQMLKIWLRGGDGNG